MYSDAETFYETIIVRNPDCWLAENNLGNLLTARGRMAWRSPISTAPGHQFRLCRSRLQPRRGADGQRAKRTGHSPLSEAIDSARTTPRPITIWPSLLLPAGKWMPPSQLHSRRWRSTPALRQARYDFAVALAQGGNIDSAIEHYRKALEIDPDLTEAHINLGTLLAGRGELDSAIEQFQRAIVITPGNEMAAAISPLFWRSVNKCVKDSPAAIAPDGS